MELNSQTKQLIITDTTVTMIDKAGISTPFITKINDLTGIEIFLPENILDKSQSVYVLFKTATETKDLKHIHCAKKMKNCYSESLVAFIEDLDEFVEYFPDVNVEKKYYYLDNVSKKITENSKKDNRIFNFFASTSKLLHLKIT